jgi:ADP-ribose pyrophosphatase YjhB (NUDIX family)
MFRYCPSCASQSIECKGNRFYCPSCGFVYYQNTAAATGCIITAGEALLFLIRGKEPSRGKLDIPGGFVDPGEGAVEGLRRECREEIGWDPGPGCSFFASFPNIYPYKNVTYTTCDLFFTAAAPDLKEADLRPAPDEISGVRFIKPPDIDFGELAFESTRRAVRAFLEQFNPLIDTFPFSQHG